jgi:hypothetical protein
MLDHGFILVVVVNTSTSNMHFFALCTRTKQIFVSLHAFVDLFTLQDRVLVGKEGKQAAAASPKIAPKECTIVALA